MFTILVTQSIAHAASPISGAVYTSAAPMDAGQASLELVVTGFVQPMAFDTGVALGPGVQAAWAPSKRWALTAAVDRGLADHRWNDVTGFRLGTRHLFVDTETTRFAVFVDGLLSVQPDVLVALGLLGVGVEHEWAKATVYASVPLIMAADGGEEPVFGFILDQIPVAAGSEAGVRFRVGEHHQVGVGLASIIPGVTWRYRGERFTAGVEYHLAGGRAHAGVVF